jgi:TRAP-type C4-dicarboxylate transport system permease small subunit
MSPRGIGDIILDWVAAVLLAATVLLSFVQVIARYALLISTPWTEELARLFFVWAVFLGAAIGVKRNLHTRVDFLFVRLPPRVAALLLAGMDLLLAGMAVIMVLYGGQLVLSTRADLSTSLGYPRNWFYLPVPLSGILMLWHLLPDLARRLSRGRATPSGREV